MRWASLRIRILDSARRRASALSLLMSGSEGFTPRIGVGRTRPTFYPPAVSYYWWVSPFPHMDRNRPFPRSRDRNRHHFCSNWEQATHYMSILRRLSIWDLMLITTSRRGPGCLPDNLPACLPGQAVKVSSCSFELVH